MTLAPGTTIGRYQILEPLGQGGMATVYKAFQPSLERDVALKVLRPGYAQDPEFRERFEREAKAIAKLRHQHIVQVFDFEVSPSGEYVLAMEFLEGGTLKERLSKLAAAGRGLDPRESVRIIGEVAEALSYAHEKGVVHRDVKPSNVMLTQKDWAVVTDFGIARILGATSYTQTGVGMGTPEYMAPEQGLGTGIDHRADIYSLGAMAYELLTGRVPYSADTPLAVVLAHIKDPLPPPSRVNPTIGRGIEKALLKALAKDPPQRFEAATAFADALTAGLAEDSRGATMPTVVVSGAAPAVDGTAPARVQEGHAQPKQLTLTIPPILPSRPILLGGAAALVLALVVGSALASSALRGSPASSPVPSGAAGSVPAVTPQGQPPPAGTGSGLPAIVTSQPGVTQATPPPARKAHSLPSRGALVYEAKLDGVTQEIQDPHQFRGTPADETLSYVPGAIEFKLSGGESSVGGFLRAPMRANYVLEFDVSATGDADGMLFISLRQSPTTTPLISRVYQLAIDLSRETLAAAYSDPTEPPGPPLLRNVPLTGIHSGQVLTIAAVVDGPRLALYVDEKLAGEVTDERVPTTTRPLEVQFSTTRVPGHGTMRILSLRMYEVR